jgi:hypothetical protein
MSDSSAKAHPERNQKFFQCASGFLPLFHGGNRPPAGRHGSGHPNTIDSKSSPGRNAWKQRLPKIEACKFFRGYRGFE